MSSVAYKRDPKIAPFADVPGKFSLDTKKRSRAKNDELDASETESETKSIKEEAEAPPSKRARRNRKRIEDDEDEVMTEASAPSPKAKKESPVRKRSRSRSRSPTSPVKPKSAKATAGKAKASKIKKEEEEKEKDTEERSIVSSSEDEMEVLEEEEEERPEITAKARKEVQTIIASKGKDPYPDWKAGAPVPYAALCKTFSLIELTTKRLQIMEHCSLFLRQVLRLTPDDLLPTVLLMINKLAPDYAGIELGIGESLIMKAIGESTGRSLQIIKQDQKEIGDLGLVAVKSRSTQPTMFKPKPLTVRGVHQGLMSIATVTGSGAQQRKVDLIKKLLSASDQNSTGKVDITKDKGGPSEAKFLIRFLEGKLRLGLAERTVIVSLAQAVVAHEAEVKGKLPSTSDMEKGESILKQVYRFVGPLDSNPS